MTNPPAETGGPYAEGTIISAVDFSYGLARCVGEHSGNVVGHWSNVLCPLRGRLCHDVRPRRGATWLHYRDAQLPYYVRLEPLDFSRWMLMSSDSEPAGFDPALIFLLGLLLGLG
jgi:hypothetical protein